MKKSFVLLVLTVIIVGSVFSQNSVTESDIIGTWQADLGVVYVFDLEKQDNSTGTVTVIGGVKGLYFIKGEDLVIVFYNSQMTGKRPLSDDKKTLTLRDSFGYEEILIKLDKEVASMAGRYYASRTYYEFKGNHFFGMVGSTPMFWGSFTVSDNTLNLHITGGVDGATSQFVTFTIIDANTISDPGGNLYKRR